MKNKYIFTFNDELTETQRLIKKYRLIYIEILQRYKELQKHIVNYQEQMLLMRNFRNETLSLLKKIVNEYVYFNNNAVVFLTGSYARNTMRLFSDIDINIVYVRGTGKKYQKYEELFYYMICKIFDKPRKSVHSIITAFNDENNIINVQKYMDNNDIEIILKDNNNVIHYTIPFSSKKRIYLQYLNNKNYKVIFDNLITQTNNNGIFEWSNNFLFLNNNKSVDMYYGKYISYILKNVDVSTIKKIYNNIIAESNNKQLKFNKIKNIKNEIQMRELYIIYNSVLLLQLSNLKRTNCSLYNSYEDISSNATDNINNIIDTFHRYNYYIIKVNMLFEKHNLEYSIHANDDININEYPDIKNLLKETIKFKEQINKTIFEILKREVSYYD